MAINQGAAIIFGNSVTGISAFPAATSSTYTSTGEDFAYEADQVEIKNMYGNVITRYFYNYRKKLSLKVFPAGSGVGAATQPRPGDKVTVTTDGSAGEGGASGSVNQIGGDYVCISSSKARSSDAHMEYSIELIRDDYLTPATIS